MHRSRKPEWGKLHRGFKSHPLRQKLPTLWLHLNLIDHKKPTITYGKVPVGGTQKVPENGEPPPLVELKVYEPGGPQISVPNTFNLFLY